MSEPLKFYHKPTCSKCREAKKVMDERGVEYEPVAYLDQPPTLRDLQKIAEVLDGEVRDMLRTKEAKEAGWDGRDDPDSVLRFLALHPEALQRPILVSKDRAVIGRDAEKLQSIL